MSRTQLVAWIDADSDVRALAVEVEARIDARSTDTGGWTLVRAETFDEEALGAWPLTFRVTPDSRTGLTYQLVATARDDRGAVLAQSRARGTLAEVRGQGLRVHFEASCLRKVPLCGGATTCSGGECLEATAIPPKLSANRATPPAGSDAGQRSSMLGNEGEECATPGAHACSGFGSRQPLTCKDGSWIMEVPCGAMMRCDSTTGTCKPIADECRGREAEVEFCDAETMRVCNRDLTTSEIRACSDNERCVTSSSGVARCECSPGFVLQNTMCIQPDSCGQSNGGCDPRTMCMPSPGGRKCSGCPSGYDGMGEKGCVPRLASLEVTAGELTPTFSPDLTSYRVRVPLLTQSVGVIARGPSDAQLMIAGVAAGGSTWTSPLLEYGENPFDIVLTTEVGANRTYRLVIERTGEEVALLRAPRTNQEQMFSWAMAMDGDTLVVGAPQDDSGGTGINPAPTDVTVTNSGAVFVYVNKSDRWEQQAMIKPETTNVDADFGITVKLAGDTLAVAEVRADVFTVGRGATRPGLVHLYTRKNGVWTHDVDLASEDGGTGGYLFGYGLDLDGDTLVVGANQEGGSNITAGAVYVYTRSSGKWSLQQKLLAPEPHAGDQFGSVVAVSGDALAVSAPLEARGSGAVYLLERTGTRWNHRQRLEPDAPVDSAAFGWDLSIRGDRLVVGVPRASIFESRPVSSGAVYVYERSSNAWSRTAILRARVPAAADHFGSAVKLSDTAILVGATGDDSDARGLVDNGGGGEVANSGAAYLFGLSDAGWELTTFIKASNPRAEDSFGGRVALSADGFAVGAYLSDDDMARSGSTANGRSTDSGAAYVFR